MSRVRVLAGTRKGAFILESDGKRQKWDVNGPFFGGWELYHLKGSPADPNRIYASQSSGWFGQLIQRSSDGGKTWEPVGNKFVYEGVPGTHQSDVQSGAAAHFPARTSRWELEATWESEEPEEDVGRGAYSERRDDSGDDPHGRTATRPKEIPKKGWRDIAVRVWHNLGRDNTSLVSAGIGLHALLAVFPALAVVVSVYGMFASPADVARELQPFLGVLPGDAAKLITDQLQSLTTPQNPALGFGAIAATLLALWNSRQGMVSLMTATNIAYNERERRSVLRQVAISIVFSLGAMLIFLVMLLVGVAVPLVLQVAPLGHNATIAVLVFRWVLLWAFAVLGYSIAYRYAPDRRRAKWRWVTWGSAVAASVWLLGSLAFSAYVQNFGSYGKTYGALGGVIVLIMWFYLMGFTIVLGAEINAEMEHQTAVDTTEGPPAPMGKRGAYVADTLGRTAK